jgi:hypothetical protein
MRISVTPPWICMWLNQINEFESFVTYVLQFVLLLHKCIFCYNSFTLLVIMSQARTCSLFTK